MKATITLEVPEYQNGQEVTVYFPDTMMKKAVCNAVETFRPYLSGEWYLCGCNTPITIKVDGEPLHKANYCSGCGRQLNWESEGDNK